MSNATRFDVDKGRIEFDGAVVYRVVGRPLVPDELWNDDRLDFERGLEPTDNDLSDVPDDLEQTLRNHGYWLDTET